MRVITTHRGYRIVSHDGPAGDGIVYSVYDRNDQLIFKDRESHEEAWNDLLTFLGEIKETSQGFSNNNRKGIAGTGLNVSGTGLNSNGTGLKVNGTGLNVNGSGLSNDMEVIKKMSSVDSVSSVGNRGINGEVEAARKVRDSLVGGNGRSRNVESAVRDRHRLSSDPIQEGQYIAERGLPENPVRRQ